MLQSSIMKRSEHSRALSPEVLIPEYAIGQGMSYLATTKNRRSRRPF